MLKELKGHKGRVNDISIHPSGKLAISVGRDRTLRLWDLRSAKKASARRLGKEALFVQWNMVGDKFAVLFDKNLTVTNLDADDLMDFSHSARLHCFRYIYHPGYDMEVLVVGSEDRHLRIISPNSGEVLLTKEAHGSRVKQIDFYRISDNEIYLTSISSDGHIKLWECSKTNLLKEVFDYETAQRLICVRMAEPPAPKSEETAAKTLDQSILDFAASNGEVHDFSGLEDDDDENDEQNGFALQIITGNDNEEFQGLD